MGRWSPHLTNGHWSTHWASGFPLLSVHLSFFFAFPTFPSFNVQLSSLHFRYFPTSLLVWHFSILSISCFCISNVMSLHFQLSSCCFQLAFFHFHLSMFDCRTSFLCMSDFLLHFHTFNFPFHFELALVHVQSYPCCCLFNFPRLIFQRPFFPDHFSLPTFPFVIVKFPCCIFYAAH